MRERAWRLSSVCLGKQRQSFGLRLHTTSLVYGGGDASLIEETERRHATVSPEQQDFMLAEHRVDLKRKRDEMFLQGL